ncbi:MAG: cupin domain-containing protein [Gaiellaceae bacterium]
MDEPIILLPGEGEVLVDLPPWSSLIKVARHELLLFESSFGPGERGAAPHIHREHADAFYVLGGELSFQMADEPRSLPVGSFVLAPPRLVHGFEVGPDGAHYLNLHVPGDAYAKLARARRDGIEFDKASSQTTRSSSVMMSSIRTDCSIPPQHPRHEGLQSVHEADLAGPRAAGCREVR